MLDNSRPKIVSAGMDARAAWASPRVQAGRWTPADPVRDDPLPWPDRKDEAWRFTPWKLLVPPSWGGEPGLADSAPPIVQFSPSDLWHEIWPYYEADGLGVFGPEERADLRVAGLGVGRPISQRQASWLARLGGEIADRFDQLVLQAPARGIWVELGAGARVNGPLLLLRRAESREWDSTLSRLYFGPGSAGTLVIVDYSSDGGVHYGADLSEILLAERAQWTIVFVQQFRGQTRRLQRTRVVLGSEAQAEVFRIDLGGAVVKAEATFRFEGKAAGLRYRGVVLLVGTQHVEVDTLQDHAAAENHSDLLVKAVVGHKAQAIHRGRIWIRRGAQRSEAYQASRNLILSTQARVHSLPMLDIEADDVRCTHASATGPIDEEELFYLQSRGLAENEARRLVVEGFLGDALRGLNHDRLISAMEDVIRAKLVSIL
ncbi:MAG: SufD family Fe-S cluster assembly protein [candidate division KSB1 bacterium]|nr:SufD family Fe-S cluster assembly protein [candidate division KSB1 bacterium]